MSVCCLLFFGFVFVSYGTVSFISSDECMHTANVQLCFTAFCLLLTRCPDDAAARRFKSNGHLFVVQCLAVCAVQQSTWWTVIMPDPLGADGHSK